MKTAGLLTFALILGACDYEPSNFEGGARYLKMEAVDQQSSTNHAALVASKDAPQRIAEQKIIKTGYISIEVADIDKAKEVIDKICKESGAYITSETQNNYEHRLQYDQVVRVPVKEFDQVILKISAIDGKIENKSINASDVTAEFIDTEARLKARKALEQRYLEILSRAAAVKDMLEIETQLAQVRGDIESMEGRLKYLSNQVSFSTLNLTFFQPLKTNFGFGNRIIASVEHGWEMLLMFCIGLISLWPFLIIMTVAAFALYRWRKIIRVKTARPRLS